MMRMLDVFLYIDRVIAERIGGFRAGKAEGFIQSRLIADQAHSFSSSSGKRFQHDRVTDFERHTPGFFQAGNRFLRPWDNRDTGCGHNLTGFRLDTHTGDHVGARPDKDDAFLLATAGKIGIFRQETVTRMDGCAGLFGYREDQFRLQVRSVGCIFGDAVGFFCIADMQGAPVDMRIDGDGGDIHHAAGTKDTHGDLAAVGY